MRRFNFKALGRLKTGEMNKTEQAYANYLEGLKWGGDILWYRFEGIKLRLADNTFLTVDFAVLPKSGELEMHEVKGGLIMDDAMAKLKIAADQYPFTFKLVRRAKGGGWDIETV